MNEAVLDPQVAELSAALTQRANVMKRHRVFDLVRTINDLRTFMAWHVFAVWDFMSLVKRLQIEYTTVRLPWCPPRRPQAARLISEIVLGEESDETPDGQYSSHFELYLSAMEEVDASTQKIRQFTELVNANMSVDDALRVTAAPAAVQVFVRATVDLSLRGDVEEVLGSFFYGREDAIPTMFKNLLGSWNLDTHSAPRFVFYLNRHIELDAGSHGPAALQLMRDELGQKKEAWIRMLSSAITAVELRIQLWDALAGVLAANDRSNTLNLAEQIG